MTPRKKSGWWKKSTVRPILRSFSRATSTTSTKWITRRFAEWYTPKRGDGFASQKSKSSESRKRKKQKSELATAQTSHRRQFQRYGERCGHPTSQENRKPTEQV